VTIAYFAAKGVKSAASGHKHTVDRIIDSVVLVLIVFLIVRTFLTRKTSKPPSYRDPQSDEPERLGGQRDRPGVLLRVGDQELREGLTSADFATRVV